MSKQEIGDSEFWVGESVEKVGGDCRFEGVVVARFEKLSGQIRYVVEVVDGPCEGVLHIYGGANLRLARACP